MDTPTIIETNKNDNGWGNGWGAGVGGFIGSMFGNGGFGGWGYGNGRAGQVGADVAIANQLEHVSDQIQQVAIANLQSANGTQMQVANTGNAQTVAMLQGQNMYQQQLCGLGAGLGEKIDRAGDQTVAAINQGVITGLQTQMATNDRLCAINSNITQQGYEERLQNQQLANQGQLQFSELRAQAAAEACATRELIRETAAQAVRDKLAECQNELAAQKAQNNLMVALGTLQTNIIAALKPTTTTAAGA